MSFPLNLPPGFVKSKHHSDSKKLYTFCKTRQNLSEIDRHFVHQGYGKFSLRLIGSATFGATFNLLHVSECQILEH